MPTHAEKIAAAKRKAEEMKAAAAAKRAAKEAADAAAAAGGGGAAAADTEAKDELFVPGEHSLILVDWDDTLFPTSSWKRRIEPGSAHPLRESKVAAISQAICDFIRTLQRFGEVKIVTHGTSGWYQKSSAVLLPEARDLLDSLPARYRDSHGQKVAPRPSSRLPPHPACTAHTITHCAHRARPQYMKSKPAGHKYMTDIGSEVEGYGAW